MKQEEMRNARTEDDVAGIASIGPYCGYSRILRHESRRKGPFLGKVSESLAYCLAKPQVRNFKRNEYDGRS